jgi:hypothetical protein
VKGPKTLAKHQTPNTKHPTTNIKHKSTLHFTRQDKTVIMVPSKDIGFNSSNDMSLFSLVRRVQQSEDALSGSAPAWESLPSISSLISLYAPQEQERAERSLQDIIREALEITSDMDIASSSRGENSADLDSKQHQQHSNPAKQ